MKIGDIVVREIYGEAMQFCILGFYKSEESGNKIAVLAFLDPTLISEASVDELSPISLNQLFVLSNNDSHLH